MPLVLAMPKTSVPFLASLAWLASAVLVGLFVYVPSHAPLSAGQAVVAWLGVAVVLLSSIGALARPRAMKVWFLTAVSLLAPCTLAIVVAVGLVRGG